MKNAFEGLAGNEARIEELLRAGGGFFWLDLDLERPGADRLGEVLGLPEHAIAALTELPARGPLTRRFHVDDEHVVFPFLCVRRPAARVEHPAGFEPLEVRVLVHGAFLVTAHRGPCEPLAELIGEELPLRRSERYLVYAVLEQMVATVYEALEHVEDAIEAVEDGVTDLRAKRENAQRIRGARARLAALRRRIDPLHAVFERVSEEIEQVAGLEPDDRRYLEQISGQLVRLVEGIDAASGSLSSLLDLRMNETIYRLTLIATIFLPLTFVTGFFGMNFGWMVDQVDTAAAFFGLGLGGLVLLGYGTWVVLNREVAGPPSESAPRTRRRRGG
jgi:magnesium transporter